ncbi:glycosyltransferase [Roseomonas elaeocarpi]|uniref:Glycosyltransferase n=1 Tax=Roseomonas elaeocarpi TaxID=907779 RepID=A0ABV6JUN3_9PROT
MADMMTADPTREHAEAAEARGDFAEAAALWSRLAAASPDSADLQYRLGNALRVAGDQQGAITALERAVSLGYGPPWAHMALGHMATGAGRNLMALTHFRAASAIDPNYLEPRFMQAFSAKEAEWFDLARRLFRALPAELPAWWDSTRHQAYVHHDRSLEVARRLLRQRRTGGAFGTPEMLHLSEKLIELGRLRRAERLLEKVTPSHPRRTMLLLRLVLRRDGAAAAAEMARAVPGELVRQPDVAVQAARNCLEANQLDQAIALLEAVPPEQQNGATRVVLSNILLTGSRAEQLRDMTRRWVAAMPEVTEPHRYLLSAERLAGRLPLLQESGEPITDLPPIPLIQYWHDGKVPEDVAQLMAGWRENNPGVQHRVYSEETARDFLRNRFGADAITCFERSTHAAMQADLFRLYFLVAEGGIYVDADEVSQRPLDPVRAALREAELVLALADGVPTYANNFFFVARPNSTVLTRALEDAQSRLLGDPNRKPAIWDVTGPGCITRALGNALLAIEDPAEARRLAVALTLKHYRSFSLTEDNLGYKKRPEGNWRLA